MFTKFLFFSALIGTGSAMKRAVDYSCIKRGQDYGREAKKVNVACVHATVLAIYTNNKNYIKKDWMPAITQDAKIETMVDCQKRCADTKDCYAFAYEWEDGFHECFLKKEMARPDICPEYQTWPKNEKDPKWHSASGPAKCNVPPRCFKYDFDYGIGNDKCDYANVLQIIANDAKYIFPDWAVKAKVKTEVDAKLKSYFDCQDRCAKLEGCQYFSYEYELDKTGDRYHECFLKNEQVPKKKGRQLSGETFGLGKDCPQYTIWPFTDPKWRGTSGPKKCQLPSSCIKVDFDYGMKTDACEYATVLKVVANHKDFPMPTWHSGAKDVDEKLLGMHDCQVLCQKLDGCDFFAYQYWSVDSSLEPAGKTHYHQCYLKKKLDAKCPEYTVWKFDHPAWRGASGPKNCPVPKTCVKQEFDYGRETSATCPYATVNKVIANSNRFVMPDWFKGTTAVDATLNSAFKCQALCKAATDCKFFSYQFEFGFHNCYLKQDAKKDCPPYVLWPFQDFNWQGASGPNDCPLPTTCFKPEFDYGRKSSDTCGYADTVKIIANSIAYDIPSWAKGTVPTAVDTTLKTPEDCQALCAKEEKCAAFAYEYEAEYVSGRSFHECFLKGAVKDGCPKYAIWPFEDPAWNGVSGPKSCPTTTTTTTAAKTTTTTTTAADDKVSTSTAAKTAVLGASMMVVAMVI